MVVGRIWSPKDVHILIPATYDYVELLGKVVVAEIKVAHQLILRWGDYPGLSGWAQ